MRILPSQIAVPSADNTEDFGSAAKRFANMYAVTFVGTATSAQYADMAERYHADAAYEPGTVVEIGGEHEITISTSENSPRVAGVISTMPGFRLNDGAGPDATHPFVALKGRVPVKIVGSCRKGDMLVTSDVPGHAMATLSPVIGALIGKALEDFDGEVGVVEVMV